MTSRRRLGQRPGLGILAAIFALVAIGLIASPVEAVQQVYRVKASKGVYIRSYKNSDPIGWLVTRDRVRVHYRQKNWACVSARHRSDGERFDYEGWIPVASLCGYKNGKPDCKGKFRGLPAKGRQCDDRRRRCESTGCNRTDAFDNFYRCVAPKGEPPGECSPCFTHEPCIVKPLPASRMPLLYTPNRFDDPREHLRNRRVKDADGKHLWPVVYLREGQKVGIATNHDGSLSDRREDRSGERWAFVAMKFNACLQDYSTSITGWFRRDLLLCKGEEGYAQACDDRGYKHCCNSDSDCPDDQQCSKGACRRLSSRAADEQMTPAHAGDASSCVAECCDGSSKTIALEPGEDCYGSAIDANLCGGDCKTRRLIADGVVVLDQPCQVCCATCSGSASSQEVSGTCDACGQAAAEYCSQDRRGVLLQASLAPAGSCPAAPDRDCSVECCDGTVETFAAGSPEECLQIVADAEACESDCGAGRRVEFEGTELYEDECERCCALCENGSGYSALRGVCESCLDEAQGFCAETGKDLIDAAWSSDCSALPLVHAEERPLRGLSRVCGGPTIGTSRIEQGPDGRVTVSVDMRRGLPLSRHAVYWVCTEGPYGCHDDACAGSNSKRIGSIDADFAGSGSMTVTLAQGNPYPGKYVHIDVERPPPYENDRLASTFDGLYGFLGSVSKAFLVRPRSLID